VASKNISYLNQDVWTSRLRSNSVNKFMIVCVWACFEFYSSYTIVDSLLLLFVDAQFLAGTLTQFSYSKMEVSGLAEIMTVRGGGYLIPMFVK
jgi:hypothetical protein